MTDNHKTADSIHTLMTSPLTPPSHAHTAESVNTQKMRSRCCHEAPKQICWKVLLRQAS